IVIANAGVGGRAALASSEGDDPEALTRIFNTNVLGVMNTVSPILPRFVGRGRGHVVVVSSLAAYLGLPDAPAYAASKAAIRIYADGLRRLVAVKGIQVTVVCPGFVETPMSEGLPFRAFVWTAERAAEHIARGIANEKRAILFPLPLAFAVQLAAL